jgi:signal transduction histidine kinase
MIVYWLREYYAEKLSHERERQEKERIKSINLVIHSILHEVKNRLNVLNLLLHRFYRTGDENYLERLRGELLTLNRYVEETSDLRRPVSLELKSFRVRRLLSDLKERLQPLFEGSDVRLKVDFQDCTLRADYGRLLSALTDLVKNAVEALSQSQKKEIKIEGKKEGKFYTFLVSDSGGELPPGDLFQPFKTTKDKGFGLGLFNVRRTAIAHGGDVKAYVSNGWTVFELRIPADCSEISPKE